MFKWIKRLFTPAPRHGMITRTCRNCGRTFSLPEDVQYWPDYCLECRQKAPEQTITRKCRGCGKMFSFSSTAKRWPNYCRECQAGRFNCETVAQLLPGMSGRAQDTVSKNPGR